MCETRVVLHGLSGVRVRESMSSGSGRIMVWAMGVGDVELQSAYYDLMYKDESAHTDDAAVAVYSQHLALLGVVQKPDKTLFSRSCGMDS